MRYFHYHDRNVAHPGALLWIIIGLLGASGLMMIIVSTTPKY